MMIANVLVGLVVLIHLYIVVLEMVLWDKPLGRKVFGSTPEFATASKVLAANQGLYNGFLAAGLIWALTEPRLFALPLSTFFLLCVLVAGIYGGATANRRIWLLQALPAAVALIALFVT